MSSSNLGIPYMGSKRKLSKKIIDFILKENPNAKYIYDLFGGGASISLEVLNRREIKEVHYNELNTGITSLLKDIIDNGVSKEYYKWVTREEFKKHKGDDCYLGGLYNSCWSFGNNQKKGYLYGKDIEKEKELLHKIVVDKCKDSLDVLNEKYNIKIPMFIYSLEGDIVKESINESRLRIVGFINKEYGRLQQLPHLASIRHLERLSKFDKLKELNITNSSYDEVIINTPIEETIIYLDPPYDNTATYQMEISHDDLYKYVDDSPYKIYMSSYKSHLECVMEMEHTSLLSATAVNKIVERLYTNNNPTLCKKEGLEEW